MSSKTFWWLLLQFSALICLYGTAAEGQTISLLWFAVVALNSCLYPRKVHEDKPDRRRGR